MTSAKYPLSGESEKNEKKNLHVKKTGKYRERSPKFANLQAVIKTLPSHKKGYFELFGVTSHCTLCESYRRLALKTLVLFIEKIKMTECHKCGKLVYFGKSRLSEI